MGFKIDFWNFFVTDFFCKNGFTPDFFDFYWFVLNLLVKYNIRGGIPVTVLRITTFKNAG